jgi:hypothetical protein
MVDKPWDIVVSSNSNRLSPHFASIWEYKDLIWLLTKRDLAVSYQQSILEPI